MLNRNQLLTVYYTIYTIITLLLLLEGNFRQVILVFCINFGKSQSLMITADKEKKRKLDFLMPE